MSLHVEVRVNSSPLGKVHISRLEQLADEQQTSLYVAWLGEYHDKVTPLNSVEFSHKYSDGALACVKKALDALEKNGFNLN